MSGSQEQGESGPAQRPRPPACLTLHDDRSAVGSIPGPNRVQQHSGDDCRQQRTEGHSEGCDAQHEEGGPRRGLLDA